MIRRRIYVAGPYTKPDPVENVKKALAVADKLFALGFAPFVPHLTHFWEILHHHEYEDWMEMDFIWLRQCHALYSIPGESSGADREVALAKELGIPVYHNLQSLYGAEGGTR